MNPATVRRLQHRCRERGLTLCRIPGTSPTWAVLGLPHTPTVTYCKGRWSASNPTVQTLINSISHDRKHKAA